MRASTPLSARATRDWIHAEPAQKSYDAVYGAENSMLSVEAVKVLYVAFYRLCSQTHPLAGER